jgi:hypothetical protein
MGMIEVDERTIATKPEEGVGYRADLGPREALKLVKRLRRVTFFVRLGVELVTERNGENYKAYDTRDNMKVSARQLEGVLRELADFNDRKHAAGKPIGFVPVSRYGDCIFFG